MSPKQTSRLQRMSLPLLAILMVLPALPRNAEAYHYRYSSEYHHSYRGFGHFYHYRSYYYSPYSYGPYGHGRYPYSRHGRQSSIGSLTPSDRRPISTAVAASGSSMMIPSVTSSCRLAGTIFASARV